VILGLVVVTAVTTHHDPRNDPARSVEIYQAAGRGLPEGLSQVCRGLPNDHGPGVVWQTCDRPRISTKWVDEGRTIRRLIPLWVDSPPDAMILDPDTVRTASTLEDHLSGFQSWAYRDLSGGCPTGRPPTSPRLIPRLGGG
jgi:hypothetical protein